MDNSAQTATLEKYRNAVEALEKFVKETTDENNPFSDPKDSSKDQT